MKANGLNDARVEMELWHAGTTQTPSRTRQRRRCSVDVDATSLALILGRTGQSGAAHTGVTIVNPALRVLNNNGDRAWSHNGDQTTERRLLSDGGTADQSAADGDI